MTPGPNGNFPPAKPKLIYDGAEHQNKWERINSVNFMCAYLTSFAFHGSSTLRRFEYHDLRLLEHAAALSARLNWDVISWNEFVEKWGNYDVQAALQRIFDEWVDNIHKPSYDGWDRNSQDIAPLEKLRAYLAGSPAACGWRSPGITPPTLLAPAGVPNSCVEQWDCVQADKRRPHFLPSEKKSYAWAIPLRPVTYGCCAIPPDESGEKTNIRYIPHVRSAHAQPSEYVDALNAVIVVYDYFRTQEVVRRRGFLAMGERVALARAKRAVFRVSFPDMAEFDAE